MAASAAARVADVPSRVCLCSRPVTGTTGATGSAARRARLAFAAVVEQRHTTSASTVKVGPRTRPSPSAPTAVTLRKNRNQVHTLTIWVWLAVSRRRYCLPTIAVALACTAVSRLRRWEVHVGVVGRVLRSRPSPRQQLVWGRGFQCPMPPSSRHTGCFNV